MVFAELIEETFNDFLRKINLTHATIGGKDISLLSLSKIDS